jgi:hypothetical protein
VAYQRLHRTADGDVTSDLCSVHLKGTEKNNWRMKTKDATFVTRYERYSTPYDTW